MISERLERLVEEMVEKGVQFEDAVQEFEKRFIVRVLDRCDGNVTRTSERTYSRNAERCFSSDEQKFRECQQRTSRPRN